MPIILKERVNTLGELESKAKNPRCLCYFGGNIKGLVRLAYQYGFGMPEKRNEDAAIAAVGEGCVGVAIDAERMNVYKIVSRDVMDSSAHVFHGGIETDSFALAGEFILNHGK